MDSMVKQEKEQAYQTESQRQQRAEDRHRLDGLENRRTETDIPLLKEQAVPQELAPQSRPPSRETGTKTDYDRLYEASTWGELPQDRSLPDHDCDR